MLHLTEQANSLEKYFHQGTKLVVTGRIQTGSYTNRDGQKVYTTEVIVEDQEFAESKNAASGNSDGGYRPAERPAPSSAIGDGFMNIPDGVEDEGFRSTRFGNRSPGGRSARERHQADVCEGGKTNGIQ